MNSKTISKTISGGNKSQCVLFCLYSCLVYLNVNKLLSSKLGGAKEYIIHLINKYMGQCCIFLNIYSTKLEYITKEDPRPGKT